MQTTKVFQNGNSQAVRLPKDFRLETDEVFLKHTTQGVLLIPKPNTNFWEHWVEQMMNDPIEDFATPERHHTTDRDSLDGLFD